jgi:hypothetical protein
MTRIAKCSVSCGDDKRDFVVHYTDDPPERSEAVRFFEDGQYGHLFADSVVTDDLWSLPIDAANAFLAAHPVRQTFDALFVTGTADVCDDDLARLVQLPELRRCHLFSRNVTDFGVGYLLNLRRLERLVLYSPLITDACLDLIACLQSLKSVDLQGSPLITKAAFDSLTTRLPRLVESWGPDPPATRYAGLADPDAAPDCGGA